MCRFKDESRGGPSSCSQIETKATIRQLLSSDESINWNVVNGLLQRLFSVSSSKSTRCSAEDDPMGRLLVGTLISRNPPTESLEAALRVFPDSLSHNPAAFFTACRDATPEVVSQMMRHEVQVGSYDVCKHECPYPWIVSQHVSIEGAKAILEAFPQGVLCESPFLSSHSPLDFFLMSDEMIEQRSFDATLWSKFKLMLVAAECCEYRGYHSDSCQISPIQMILKRILSRSDFLDNIRRSQHVLWLLHQLRWTDQWVFQRKSSDGSYPLHFVLSRKCTEDREGLVAARELIKILLEAHPASAMHRLGGRLPLHMAIENGWPCHDLLLSVYPDALNVADPKTELIPFQSAAEQAMESSSSMSLDITYELLRANPTNARAMVEDGTQVGAQA